MAKSKRTFIIAVINSAELLRRAVDRFLLIKSKHEHILFMYNIGRDLTTDGIPETPLNKIIILFNCDSDLITLKPYDADYLTATADATTIGTQLAGTGCEDFKYYNFFAPPKRQKLSIS